MEYLVGTKGQVVIAKAIRESLGVGPGWLALQRLVDDHVEVYFLPPRHRRSLKSSLASHIKRSVGPGQPWQEAREEAWSAALQGRAPKAEPAP